MRIAAAALMMFFVTSAANAQCIGPECWLDIAKQPIPKGEDAQSERRAQQILFARELLKARHEGYIAGQKSNGAPDPIGDVPLFLPSDHK